MSASPSVDDRPARLSVGVVGAGRVGVVLAAALAQAGHKVVAVSAVSDASRRRVDELLPGTPVLAPPQVLAAAELVLLTVPDDVLPGLVEGLAAAGAIAAGQLLVHTSGRYGVAVLDPATRRGRAAAGAAPGDDVHRPARGPGPAGRRLLRRHRAGAAAPDRRGARRRDGRRPAVGRRGAAPALPRGARGRRRTTSRPSSTSRWTCCAGAASRSRSGCSRRCSVPRSTTRCGPGTRRSPVRSRAATRAPSPRTSACCARCRRTPPRPTSRWPA